MPVSHLGLTVSHLPSASSFYLAALQPLRYRFIGNQGDAIGFGVDSADFFITQKSNSARISPTHIAFLADDHSAVRECYTAALNAGGRKSGSPAHRHEDCDCFNAAVYDLDGNTVEFIYRQPHGTERSDYHGTPSEHNRILHWQEGVADGGPPPHHNLESNAGSVKGALDIVSRIAPSEPRHGMDSSSVGSASREKSESSSLIDGKTFLGAALGAAAGAALAFAITKSERQNAREEAAFVASLSSSAPASVPMTQAMIPAQTSTVVPRVVYYAASDRTPSTIIPAQRQPLQIMPAPSVASSQRSSSHRQPHAETVAPTVLDAVEADEASASEEDEDANAPARLKFHRNFSSTESAFSSRTRSQAPGTHVSARTRDLIDPVVEEPESVPSNHEAEDDEVLEAISRYNNRNLANARARRRKTYDDLEYECVPAAAPSAVSKRSAVPPSGVSVPHYYVEDGQARSSISRRDGRSVISKLDDSKSNVSKFDDRSLFSKFDEGKSTVSKKEAERSTYSSRGDDAKSSVSKHDGGKSTVSRRDDGRKPESRHDDGKSTASRRHDEKSTASRRGDEESIVSRDREHESSKHRSRVSRLESTDDERTTVSKRDIPTPSSASKHRSSRTDDDNESSTSKRSHHRSSKAPSTKPSSSHHPHHSDHDDDISDSRSLLSTKLKRHDSGLSTHSTRGHHSSHRERDIDRSSEVSRRSSTSKASTIKGAPAASSASRRGSEQHNIPSSSSVAPSAAGIPMPPSRAPSIAASSIAVDTQSRYPAAIPLPPSIVGSQASTANAPSIATTPYGTAVDIVTSQGVSKASSYVSAPQQIPLSQQQRSSGPRGSDSSDSPFAAAAHIALPSSSAPSYLSAAHMALPASRAASYVSVTPSRRGPGDAPSGPSSYVSATGIPLPDSIANGEDHHDAFTAGEESDGLGDMCTVVPDDSVSCIDLPDTKARRASHSSNHTHKSSRSHASRRSSHTHAHTHSHHGSSTRRHRSRSRSRTRSSKHSEAPSDRTEKAGDAAADHGKRAEKDLPPSASSRLSAVTLPLRAAMGRKGESEREASAETKTTRGKGGRSVFSLA